MIHRLLTLVLVPFLAGLMHCHAAQAQAQTQTGGPTPSPAGAAVYFIGLKDGDTLPTKAILHFGLHGMGVAPAGSDRANSGHHHLIIDSPTPPLNSEIPNDFQHLHFGAGQTEAEISLTPGEHTLQLVFGDKNHVPHSPPVTSEKIKVKVTDQTSPAVAQAAPAAVQSTAGGRRPSPKDAKVYFIYPKNGSYISPNPVIRFGLLNMGVAPAGYDKPNTGHHHLLVDAELPPLDQPIPNDFNHLHFGAGQTEAKITLPVGQHKLRLLFADFAHVPQDPAVFSDVISVTVTESGQPPRKRSKYRHRSWRRYGY
ncbi:DUF4399 domain-containing protein [Bradyrhizobium sp. WSM1253]|uniref:DUF4399 domain-containing protein n=1 Tax=Bradyrhizobium sp. WSM1253 TaxID=319003 RepID=UPI00025D122F|nr:DUF4399 domain-containing protein [Bradyrhizobium sp. WSM1253]EIG63605.1 hypothetical protein Bra1253DRAFT_00099 [Bradyrhizobium sp. WSM1253]